MSDARTVLREFSYLDCGWYPHEKASDKCARCDGFADAILAALAEAGFVVVPQVPTDAMAAEGALNALITERSAKLIWRAMVEAANE